MIYIALCICSAFCALVALVVPRLDRVLVYFLGVCFSIVAAIRIGGFDYSEHIDLVAAAWALGSEDYLIRLLATKDPVFLLVADLVGFLGLGERVVISLIVIFSVALKIVATSVFGCWRTVFMSAYIIFISPGFEFAAIRAGLGLSFIMLVWRLSRVRWLALVAAIASHASMIVAGVGYLLLKWAFKWRVIVAFLLLTIVPFVIDFIGGIDRFVLYLDNKGTLAATFLPLLTIAVYCIFLWGGVGEVRGFSGVSGFCFFLAIFLAVPSVTVSFRILEMGWLFFLMALVYGFSVRRGERLVVLIMSLVLFFVVLAVSNFLRDTWVILMDSSVWALDL